MADRTPPWPDRTVQVPPGGPVDPWAGAGPSWPDRGDSWPDRGDSWPDAGAWPGSAAPGNVAPGSGGRGPGSGSAAPGSGGRGPGGGGPAYHRGRAQVGQPGPQAPSYETYPATSSWPDSGDRHAAPPRAPMRHQLRQLRRGGEWTLIGGLFAFICWGIWAISVRGDLTVPVLAFVLVLLVAVGVFALSRLLGMVVLERTMGRTRRSAWASHLVTGLFLAASGVAYLRQTEWVIDAWSWLRNLG